MDEYNVPDEKSIEILEDYYCPLRKRVVLHKGCIYLAPLFACRFQHKKVSTIPKKMLRHFIDDGLTEDEISDTELETRHKDLLKASAPEAIFQYDNQNEIMLLNGEQFVKGIAAKILKQLLENHLKDGQTEFEYKDFKRRFEISLGQKNSNFEVRFYRLSEKFEKRFPTIRLNKLGRGRFILQLACNIKLVNLS